MFPGCGEPESLYIWSAARVQLFVEVALRQTACTDTVNTGQTTGQNEKINTAAKMLSPDKSNANFGHISRNSAKEGATSCVSINFR